jgi:hypothetical protein
VRKNILKTFKSLSAADMSLASVSSQPTNTENLDSGVAIVNWSGTDPVGVLTVQGRNIKQDANGLTDSGWADLDFDTINITGASGKHQLIFTSLPYTEIRFVYTRTSGSGAMDIFLTAKQVGG